MHRRGFSEVERPAITSAIFARLDHYARQKAAAAKKAENGENGAAAKKRKNAVKSGASMGGKRVKKEVMVEESEDEEGRDQSSLRVESDGERERLDEEDFEDREQDPNSIVVKNE